MFCCRRQSPSAFPRAKRPGASDGRKLRALGQEQRPEHRVPLVAGKSDLVPYHRISMVSWCRSAPLRCRLCRYGQEEILAAVLPGHVHQAPDQHGLFPAAAGWNKIFSYLRHEFFNVAQLPQLRRRPFSPTAHPASCWCRCGTLPGVHVLYEGIKKIGEGWLESPKLVLFFRGADQILRKHRQQARPEPRADAVAARLGRCRRFGPDQLEYFRLSQRPLVTAGTIALRSSSA